MDDKAKALALDIAKDLDGELGGGIVAELQRDNKTRAFGLNEAAAIAGLILSGVQIALQFLSDKKISALEAHLEASLPKPGKVSPAKRASIIRNVLEKISGGGPKGS